MKPEGLPTRIALARDGEHSYCGHRVFADLLGPETMTGLLWLAVGGRRLAAEERAVLDDAAVALSVADPRIWPLKIARIAASYGGSLSGVAAGMVMLQDAAVGAWSFGEAARLLDRVADLSEGPDGARRKRVCELVHATPRLPGFGVAFRAQDERVLALRAALTSRGWNSRRYMKALDLLADVARAERRVEPNIGLPVAAVLLELGLELGAISILSVALLQHMFFANAAEGAQQKAAVLRSLPDECVRYAGAPARLSPRATQRVGSRRVP